MSRLLVTIVNVSMATMCYCYHVHVDYNSPHAVTCYTCPRMFNNSQCNRWAPDIPCPVEDAVCRTVHRFSKTNRTSVHVEKSCSLPEHCTPQHVGCKQTDVPDEMECVSCCSTSYCNDHVPDSASTSHQLSQNMLTSRSSHVVPLSLVLIMVTDVIAGLLFCLLFV